MTTMLSMLTIVPQKQQREECGERVWPSVMMRGAALSQGLLSHLWHGLEVGLLSINTLQPPTGTTLRPLLQSIASWQSMPPTTSQILPADVHPDW